MLKYDTINQADNEFLMRTYKRQPALFVQGSGCALWDNRGNEYLDMLAGIAVCSLGHCHPAVASALARQSQQLMVVSGYLLTAPQAQLAERLCKISGMDRVWYGVDGTGSIECGLKIAKKHGNSKRPDGDCEIICLHGSFHGRTMGSLSATGQRKYQRPFEPLVPGFVHINANSVEELKEVVSHKTAAILLEPIMGEGGILELTPTFLETARRLADEHNAFLIFDEVQCGIARTGAWFAWQHSGVKPDIMCLAKGLGSGMPISACLARGKAADVLEPGDHGSTFGGSPITAAVGLAVLDTIEHQDIIAHVNKVGAYLRAGLEAIGAPIVEVSGRGLMLGAALDKPIAKDIVAQAFERKLIINATDESHLRFVPPLIITEAQIDHALGIVADLLGKKHTHRAAPATPRPSPLHDVLGIDDLTDAQLEEVLSLAAHLKTRRNTSPAPVQAIEGRTVAMVFEKPSLRTRVSFEAAIQELGGHPVYLTKADIAMGQREAIKDVATNLSGWVSVIVARLFWHKHIEELAHHASVPVVNALTEWEHPCQALADLQTIREEFGDQKVKITYVGDANNVSRSLAKLATRLGYPMTICGPENFRLEDMDGLTQTPDLEEGLSGAQVVYTDVWISMGDEHEQEHRLKVFDKYQVNDHVFGMAAKDAIFMHCLPARRGFEVTDSVIDSRQSRIDPQAENRLHAQKALLKMVLGI
jgi:ornithine carbamoyltransferase